VDDHSTHRLRAGQLAAICGATPRALRLYEARGLLGSVERSEAGQRLYGVDSVVRALRIRSLRRLGFTIDDIGRIVDASGRYESVADPAVGKLPQRRTPATVEAWPRRCRTAD
jgi:DNA-binding transcriptional MerR regulator